MNIPTVPGSEISVQTSPTAVPMSEGAMNARYRGDLTLAGGLENLGSAAGAIADDLNRAHEAKIAADVAIKLRASEQTFFETINNTDAGWKNVNESGWKDQAKQTADSVREEIFSAEHIPPGLREHINSSFSKWQQGFLIKAQSGANVQNVNRARGKLTENYLDALRSGNAAEAQSSVNLMRSTRVADPAETDQMEREIPKTIAVTSIETGIRNNPKGTYDLLKSGASLPAVDQNGKAIVPNKVLSPKELETLTNTARIQTSVWQKQNFEQMLASKTDPNTGFVDDGVIEHGMKVGEIDEITGRNLIRAQDKKLKADTLEANRALKAEDSDRYKLISAKIHDPTAWGLEPDLYAKQIIQDASEISSPILRQKAINEANTQLKAVKKTGEVAQRPVEQAMYKLINEDKETQGAMVPVAVQDMPGERVGGFKILGLGSAVYIPKVDTPGSTKYVPIPGGLRAVNKEDFDVTQFGPEVTKDELVSAVNLHAARVQHDMAEWFKTEEGQKATFEQANDHRMELERPYVMDSVRNALAKKVPAVPTTKAEVDAIPSGATFLWNGQLLTKK